MAVGQRLEATLKAKVCGEEHVPQDALSWGKRRLSWWKLQGRRMTPIYNVRQARTSAYGATMEGLPCNPYVGFWFSRQSCETFALHP